MSSRALRRLQKEQLEATVPSDEESEPESKPVKKFNPFDLLNDNPSDHDEEEQEQEQEEPIYQPVQKSKKKNKKKKKKQAKQEEDQDDEDFSMKDLDNVLKEFKLNSQQETESHPRICHELLSVNYRYLDAEAEMKRLFGSHVVNSERQQTQSRVLKKSKFTTPKSEWPPYKRHGLSMELIETKDGVGHYAFRHAETYQDVQIEFLNAVAMHHPEALLFLTRKHPYHVDSLLQLSEIAKYSGDWTTAGDFIERALYACERALHPQFSLGNSRLSYQRSENRSFFLAIFRHIQFLTRRGCWKTAFEFNKLLFSLDPESDPLGSLLSLDYHALSSRDYDYLIRLASDWKTAGVQYPVDLMNLPNMAFSSAYAQFKLSVKKKGSLTEADRSLQLAIQKYPSVYYRLMEKLGEPSTAQLDPNSDYMEIVQQLYVERTHGLWKEPEVLDWLKQNASAVKSSDAQHALLCQQTIPVSVYRHLVLIDIQSLLHYLPTDGQSIQMYDPFPPEDSVTQYDINDRVRSNTPRIDENGMMGILRNLLGHAGDNMEPEQQQRIHQLMTELEQLREQRANLAPGAFPQDSDEEDEGEEDDLHPLEDATLNHQGLSTEEMMDIMQAVGDEDLEVQRVLTEAFERNQRE